MRIRFLLLVLGSALLLAACAAPPVPGSATTSSAGPPTASSSPPPATSSASYLPRPASSTDPFDPFSRPPLGTPQHPIRLEATGQVLVDLAGHAELCPPHSVPADSRSATPSEPVTPECPSPIPAGGIDVQRLSQAEHNSTHRWGAAHVEGLWDGTRLQVSVQTATGPVDPLADFPDLDHIPCAAPVGGWKTGHTQDDPGIDKIQAAVGAATFGALVISRPTVAGHPAGSIVVILVSTAEDPAVTTAAVRSVYAGNICVTRSANSDADIQRQHDAVDKVLGTADQWAKFGIWSMGTRMRPLGNPFLTVEVGVDSQGLRDVLAGIKGPAIGISPWLRPVG